MGETRVNIKHLLEDIRDSYPFPAEEAIITELIANAFDSEAARIALSIDPAKCEFTVVDNGTGMNSSEFEGYHDIAATAKVRGKGIGFAGVGAKLALLICSAVITETRKRDFHRATRWWLEDTYRAPWEYCEVSGLIGSSGTAVCFRLSDRGSLLLDASYVKEAIERHFYPILDQAFDQVLQALYPGGIEFLINGQPISPQRADNHGEVKYFLVRLGRRDKPIGVGYVAKIESDLGEDRRGIAVSTYGKVIKRGWDWIGLNTKNPNRLTGIVEVPKLVELLTTNKADFLKDGTSYQKYLRYRKAIQEAIGPILREFGEEVDQRRDKTNVQPLEREIEQVLRDLVPDFPELASLLGARGRSEATTGILPDPQAVPVGVIEQGVGPMTGTKGGGGEGTGIEVAPGELPGERIALAPEPTERGRIHEGRRKRPALMIGFEDDPNRDELGWLTESTVWVNRQHPAYRRALRTGADTYHVMLTVGCVLSVHLESEKSPQQFINRFLALWGLRE